MTEQGGLMWGEYAVGKLVAGADALSPQVQPFADEDTAPEVTEKVRRRLGHWIDRKIAALFQPLIALRDDEALTGMARGIAFRLVEALGVVPRAEIAEDVKALDQDGRASLRKHGVRFGQYTVFQPLLLKPAPTRLRLVLWSLASGFEVFPEAPPPGLVTVAAVPDAPPGYYPRAGYRLAGERGDPHRHAGAARRHDPQPRRPRRLRGGPGNAVDHRPEPRAVRQAHAGHGLPGDRRHPPEAQAAGRRSPRPPQSRRRGATLPAMAAAARRRRRRRDPTRSPASRSDVGRRTAPASAESRRARRRPRRCSPAIRNRTCPSPEVPPPLDPDVPPPEPADVPPPDAPDVPIPSAAELLNAAAPGERRADEPQETETFYLFTRGQRRRPERPARPERKREGKPKGKPRHAEGETAGRPRHAGRGDRKGKREGKRGEKSRRRRRARSGPRSRSTRTTRSRP